MKTTITLSRAMIFLTLLTLMSPAITFGCPIFLFAGDLPSPGFVGKRHELQAWALEEKGKKRWAKKTVQIDPVSARGELLFFSPGEDWRKAPVRPLDRLSLRAEDFGPRAASRTPMPCGARQVWSVSLKNHPERHLYLARCPPAATTEAVPVRHEPIYRKVISRRFLYRYAADNPLLFDHLEFRSAFKDHYIPIGFDSDQRIHANLKSFPSLQFGSRDFEVAIQAERNGPLGLVGELNFFWRVMFLKLDLNLTPEVNFFDNTVYMPMIMHLPVDAEDYLHPGSGLYYTWRSGPEVHWDIRRSRIPLFHRQRVAKGRRRLAEVGALFCRKDRCEFDLRAMEGRGKPGPESGRRVRFAFIVPRNLVDLGFFPLLIRDAFAVEEELGYGISRFRARGRMGVYFDTSALPAGSHGWDFRVDFFENETDRRQREPLCMDEPLVGKMRLAH